MWVQDEVGGAHVPEVQRPCNAAHKRSDGTRDFQPLIGFLCGTLHFLQHVSQCAAPRRHGHGSNLAPYRGP